MSDKSIFMQEIGMPWIPEVGEAVIYHGNWRDMGDCKMVCCGYQVVRDNYFRDFDLFRVVLSTTEEEKPHRKVVCGLRDVSRISFKKDVNSKRGAL